MARGLPKAYIKKYGISKAAWAAYRRDRGSNPRKSRATRVRGAVRTMVKRSRSITIPVAVIAGAGAVLVDRWPTTNRSILDAALKGDIHGVLYESREHLLGIDLYGKFHPEWLMRGWLPVIAGLIVHKVIGGWLGVNRMLGRAKVPFIRV